MEEFKVGDWVCSARENYDWQMPLVTQVEELSPDRPEDFKATLAGSQAWLWRKYWHLMPCDSSDIFQVGDIVCWTRHGYTVWQAATTERSIPPVFRVHGINDTNPTIIDYPAEDGSGLWVIHLPGWSEDPDNCFQHALINSEPPDICLPFGSVVVHIVDGPANELQIPMHCGHPMRKQKMRWLCTYCGDEKSRLRKLDE